MNKEPVTKIPMLAVSDINYNYPSNKNLGKITLKRKMVKIRVESVNLEVEGYSLVNPKYRLVNYTTKGYLDKMEKVDNSLSQMGESDYQDGNIFYSYFHHWGDTPNEQPILMIQAEVKRNDSSKGLMKVYYKVPLNTPGAQLNCNYLYETVARM